MAKKKKFLVVDVETANPVDSPLVYDIGVAIVDKKGKVYESESYIIWDIFIARKDLMETAYYAVKVPKYEQDIIEGLYTVTSFYFARKQILEMMKRHNVNTVAAYNCHFDRGALNNTLNFLTDGKYRYFFPYKTKFICIWHMACQVLCTQKSFVRFAMKNGFYSEKGNMQTSAEAVYAYMRWDKNYEEDHTGLADVMIEKDIMARCFRQHKKMDTVIKRNCWMIPQKIRKEMQLEGL